MKQIVFRLFCWLYVPAALITGVIEIATLLIVGYGGGLIQWILTGKINWMRPTIIFDYHYQMFYDNHPVGRFIYKTKTSILEWYVKNMKS